MSNSIIGVDQLSEAVKAELTLYSDNIIKGVKNQAKKSMSQLVKETRATAPVGRRGKYHKAITSKKMSENPRSISYVWYVKGSEYRLSHLLERGHALRNGGRTSGTHFIQNASDPIIKDYAEKVEEIIKNG